MSFSAVQACSSGRDRPWSFEAGLLGARRSEDAVEVGCCKTPVSGQRETAREGRGMEANSYHHTIRALI